MSHGRWLEFQPLLAVLKNRHVKISAIVPALDYLRDHPDDLQMLCDQTEAPDWEGFDRLTEICDRSWAISTYLDPAYLYEEEDENEDLEGEDREFAAVLRSRLRPPQSGHGGPAISRKLLHSHQTI